MSLKMPSLLPESLMEARLNYLGPEADPSLTLTESQMTAKLALGLAKFGGLEQRSS